MTCRGSLHTLDIPNIFGIGSEYGACGITETRENDVRNGNSYKLPAIPISQKYTLKSRLDYSKVAPGVRDAMLNLAKYVHSSGLEESLVNLVDIRASQINGCA